MRILVIHTVYKIKGGEDSVVFNETDLLQSAGHDVKLLLFSNTGGTLAKVAQLPFNYSSYKKTKSTLKTFKPDIVHIHNLHFAGSVSVLYAIKKNRTPMVVTLHNYRLLCPSGTLFFKDRLFTSSINKLLPFEAIGKGVYQNSRLITLWIALSGAVHQLLKTWNIPDKFIVLGNKQRDIFLNSRYKNLAERMEIKPNFCYPSPINKSSAGGYYLYVGRLSPEKGIKIMLSAFSGTNFQLKIVGSGPLEGEVKRYAENYINITFLGLKEKEAVYELLSNATALIFPSVWYETFGMVIIEAFACGTPVIASSAGEAKNIVHDKINGLLFDPNNSNDLVNKLNYYETLPDKEKMRYSDNALQSYQNLYKPEINLSQLEKIYKSIA